MTITLYTSQIFDEVRQKSHYNVQGIKDAEERDNARAGVENTAEIRRCVIEGFAQLSRRCMRFLSESVAVTYDDSEAWPQSYAYVFAFGERRGANKAEPLTGVMHAFVVQYALSKWYSTTSQSEQSNKYSLQAIDSGNQIDELLYHKQPPRV